MFLEDSNVPSPERQNKMISMVALGQKRQVVVGRGLKVRQNPLFPGVYGIVSHVYVSIPVNKDER